jgi:hypothetical protein
MRPERKGVAIFWPFAFTLRATIAEGGHVLATAAQRRYTTAASVRIEDERPTRTGFYGEYFRPAATRSHRTVLLSGGSEGCLHSGQPAGVLASHGYPVLELAYFSEPGLPQNLQRIPLECFKQALRWLAAQPEVDPARIVMAGVSRGGEGALLIASTYPDLVHAGAPTCLARMRAAASGQGHRHPPERSGVRVSHSAR